MRSASVTGIAPLACALCLGVAGAGFAQGQPRAFAFQEQLKPFSEQVRDALGNDYERFTETLDELVAQEARQRGLVGEVGFSVSGNEAGDFTGIGPGNDTLFTIRTSGEVSRGTFPSRLRLLADMNAQIRNNTLQQEVTRLRASYDYQYTDRVGAFGFVERYTDNFMSIESRYEIGGGVSFGIHLGPRRSDARGARALAHLASAGSRSFGCAVQQLRDTFHPGTARDPAACPPSSARAAAGGSSASAPRPTATVFDGLHAALPDLQQAITAEESWVYLGLGVGVFSEFENALIETRVSEFEPEAFETPLPGSAPVPTGPDVPITELPQHVRELAPRSVRIPAMHRYRLLLWPTIGIRPHSTVSVNFIPSFKLPISNPRKFFDGELAYRMDWFVRINWALSEDATGAERVKLFLKFDYYKNMGPPMISDDLIADAAREHAVYHRAIASKKHRVVSLGVAIGL